ncbi:hypothetical protein GCM10010995_16390 [Cysteiniphilum litorale]|uniref:RHS repeat-associated core domain-containing protein n=2 Tax=Cysteiniphilum litorale TaxID=2056700 RepID=A0A8J2Z4N2_9GAMM|nr:RHS repeat-associated core domain-containing protein [Cysteiniphilum sp. SYW-8]GGF99819.1 hypothetical protein GCM10010995_16390 [Cysteiniphilum litorale]
MGISNLTKHKRHHFGIVMSTILLSTLGNQSYALPTFTSTRQVIDKANLLHYVIEDNAAQPIQYDQNGNIIFDNNENQLSYDSNDKLIKITQKDGAIIYYHYNAVGQQIKQTVNNAEALYHYYNNGAINEDLQNGNLNYYTEAALLRITPSGIQKHFYVKDNLGSTISLIDHHNKLQHYYRYLPFGFESDVLDHDPKSFDVFDLDSSSKTYNGILSDHTSGLQFLGNGYRAYNPQLRQFMQQDSLSPFDAGGINGYTYSDNNPIMAFDPSGHSSVWQKIWGHGGSTIFSTIAPIALMPLAGPLAFVIPSVAFGAAAASIAADSINNATYHQNWQQQMKSTGWKNAVIAAGSAEATGIVSSGTGALLSPAIAGTTGAVIASAAAGAITQAGTSQSLAMALGTQQGFNIESFVTNAAIGTAIGIAAGIIQTTPKKIIVKPDGKTPQLEGLYVRTPASGETPLNNYIESLHNDVVMYMIEHGNELTARQRLENELQTVTDNYRQLEAIHAAQVSYLEDQVATLQANQTVHASVMRLQIDEITILENTILRLKQPYTHGV